MTTTYREIEQEALAADEIRVANVVALGDGENPSGVMGCLRCGGDGRQMVAADGFFECQNCGALYELDDMHPTPDRWEELWRHIEATRKRNCDNAAQVREWQQAQPGCTGQLCSECSMSDEDCADYSESLHSAGREVRPAMTAQGLEIAGAHTPRCDH